MEYCYSNIRSVLFNFGGTRSFRIGASCLLFAVYPPAPLARCRMLSSSYIVGPLISSLPSLKLLLLERNSLILGF